MGISRVLKHKTKKDYYENHSFHDNLFNKKEEVLNYRPLKVTINYILFGIVWILFSDRMTHILFKNHDTEVMVMTIKGWLFVIATALLIFGMLTRLFNEIKKLFDDLMESYREKEAVEEELRENINELKEKERLLKESYERYNLAVACSNDIVWEWDILSNKLIFSDKINYYLDNNMLNKTFTEFIDDVVKEEDKEKCLEEIRKNLRGESDFYKSEYRILQRNGKYIWVLSTGKAIRNDENVPVKMFGSIKDIDERKSYEQNLYKMAFYDSLTGLSNRKYFLNELDDALNSRKRCSVLYIDIDDFKKINDVRGHDLGDELLIFVAGILNSITDENNLISRTGGDEFSILLKDVKEKEEVTKMCNKIISRFKMPQYINGKSIYTSLSIGISIYPDDGEDVNSLIKKADIAMYKSKALGKNCYSFFSKQMSDELTRKVEIERNLRRADFDEEFQVYYQPQINIDRNELIGFEALLRWTNKELGSVSPSEFIPIAEETGLIGIIGDWVIRKVCDDCRKWQDEDYKFHKVSINISVKQLQNKDFFNSVNAIIQEKQVKAEFFKFEITESVLIDNYNNNIQMINSFINMGIQVALDDFGTGNSSINYLRRLPINTLKIDKSFIDNIEESKIDRAIIKKLIGLAKSIHIDVIVEGVEMEGQVQVLRRIGCTQIQGYYYSKPLPIELAEELLKNPPKDLPEKRFRDSVFKSVLHKK